MDTFLVQVWVPADDLSRCGDLHGMVRHVATGTETVFRREEEILVLLRQAAGKSTSAGGPIWAADRPLPTSG